MPSAHTCPRAVTSAAGLLGVAVVRALRLSIVGKRRGVVARIAGWLFVPGLWGLQVMAVATQPDVTWRWKSASAAVSDSDGAGGRVRPALLFVGLVPYLLVGAVAGATFLAPSVRWAVSAVLVGPVVIELVVQLMRVVVDPGGRSGRLRETAARLGQTEQAHTWGVLTCLVAGRPGRGDGRELIEALAGRWRRDKKVVVAYPAGRRVYEMYLTWGAVPVGPRAGTAPQGHRLPQVRLDTVSR